MSSAWNMSNYSWEQHRHSKILLPIAISNISFLVSSSNTEHFFFDWQRWIVAKCCPCLSAGDIQNTICKHIQNMQYKTMQTIQTIQNIQYKTNFESFCRTRNWQAKLLQTWEAFSSWISHYFNFVLCFYSKGFNAARAIQIEIYDQLNFWISHNIIKTIIERFYHASLMRVFLFFYCRV